MKVYKQLSNINNVQNIKANLYEGDFDKFILIRVTCILIFINIPSK